MEVPTKTSLADIYPEDALQAQTTRWNNLLSTFKDTYGKPPDFVSRSPGRVNIIGEVSCLPCLEDNPLYTANTTTAH
jgi:galactokinase